ncbi:hypothetical protein EAO72_13595 [Streptomyces sp. or43]|nr:hypothetical protein EAO72_13595 [Streptomyces sp. or43]
MPRRLCAAGPAALTLLCGLWGITRGNSMWRDEAATWQVSHRAVPEIWHLLGTADVVHGLYYLFMHRVFAVFGASLLSLRLPSVLAISGATALVTLLGTRLAGSCTGLAAGLSFALIPAVQQYAQEGRSYALVTACVALACLLLVAAVDRPGAGRWAAYGTTVLAAALLNWFSLLVLCAHAVTLALARPLRTAVLRWAVAAATAVVGTLPLIMVSGTQTAQVAWIPQVRRNALVALALTLLTGALCAWLARPGKDRRTPLGTRTTLTSAALPLLAVPQLLLLADPLVRPRYVLFSHLGLALLIVLRAARIAPARRKAPQPRVRVAPPVGGLGPLTGPPSGERGAGTTPISASASRTPARRAKPIA